MKRQDGKTGGGRKKAVPTTARKTAAPRKPVRRTVLNNSVVFMTSTQAQNGFGRVIDTVARDGTVFITKHNSTQVVVISAERYEALTRANASTLSTLTKDFDELLERMQRPESRAAMQQAFGSSPAKLSRAAIAAAKKRRAG